MDLQKAFDTVPHKHLLNNRQPLLDFYQTG